MQSRDPKFQPLIKENNMTEPINKTMDRADLFDEVAQPTVAAINQLIRDVYSKKLAMTSWYGTLEAPDTGVGLDNRGDSYEPLPGAVDDNRIPWYLYWEIEWVIRNGPKLKSGMRILDAGGTSSLFSSFLASLGVEVHSIDINPQLIANAKKLARKMRWNVHAYAMDIEKMEFDDMFFDYAYSICVFEHLDFYTKQKAMVEIHRCLKPQGQLCLTFDYMNPAPFVFGYNQFDSRPRNALNSPRRLKEVLCAGGLFELLGNQEFSDNGQRYLTPPQGAGLENAADYTFGAMFLKKKDFF
jgi:2-polyprenyl-3-methyl-5-hydroxy-6-metoxy-1,4-benzoquinol methylase